MSDESLRALWMADRPADKDALLSSIASVLADDRAARDRERWERFASVLALGLLCPVLLWCAAHGRTPIVRGAYALMAIGTALAVFAEWMHAAWAKQALPGPIDTRSQLQTSALLLSRQAALFQAGAAWSAPIFLGSMLIGVWIYQERSHSGAVLLWALTGAAWLLASLIGAAKARQLAARRSRLEQMLAELDVLV